MTMSMTGDQALTGIIDSGTIVAPPAGGALDFSTATNSFMVPLISTFL
jgi:hypothetical protein